MNKQEITDILVDCLKDLQWARMTIKDKLKFGMPEDQAIKFREKRVNGVLITVIPEIIKIIEGIKKWIGKMMIIRRFFGLC